jgi:predicted DNA-binding transcriptional regulator AlpA
MERLTMTLPEFAQATGISRGLAYDLARRDKLPVPVIRLGRRMVLSRRAVEDFFSGNDTLRDKEECDG